MVINKTDIIISEDLSFVAFIFAINCSIIGVTVNTLTIIVILANKNLRNQSIIPLVYISK